MVGQWEVHKRAFITIAYLAAVIGGFALFLSILSALVGPVVAGIITIAIPAALGFYYVLYTQHETEMMMEEKWQEMSDDMINERTNPLQRVKQEEIVDEEKINELLKRPSYGTAQRTKE